MSSPIITLLTDFGSCDWYVAAMKGVIVGICPGTQVIDITHDVRPGDIRQGAYLWDQAARCFPAEAVHVAVVDPGVGTEREIVYVEMDHGRFISPNNGLLSRVADRGQMIQLRRVENERLSRHPVSATFHGRDIMAPVAAHLATGLDPEQVGAPLDELVRLPTPHVSARDGVIDGEVIHVDHFGNLVTNIPRELVSAALVEICGRTISGLVPNFASAPPGQPASLIGSSDSLEIVVNRGSAAEMLGAVVGTAVTVRS